MFATQPSRGSPRNSAFLPSRQGLPCASLREGEDFLAFSHLFCKWVACSPTIPQRRPQSQGHQLATSPAPLPFEYRILLFPSPIDLVHLVRLDVLKRRFPAQDLGLTAG